MRYLLTGALLALLPATASAQLPLSFTTGYRAAAGPQFDAVRAGPLFGIDVKPIRWGWGALGLELSHAPRLLRRDSGNYSPAGQGCFGPDGELTTCASIRRHVGEGTTQLGAVAVFGPRNRRVAPFGELALGYYAAHMKDRIDIWDPEGRHLTNLSSNVSNTEGGVYARIGAGVEFAPWPSGPALFLTARYRWARLGFGIGDWTEWFNERKGGEVVAGVRLR
jgi:hypothetical protein